MPIAIPPAKNYSSPLVALPSKYANTPPEGSMIVPCEIDWGPMGGSNNCVAINMQNNATLNFSQICGLAVDNSACGADVQFVFSDTSETMTVPAFTPKVIIPVFTNQTQFFVFAAAAEASDVTRFSILNTLPPPIAVPITQEQTIAAVPNVAANIVATTQIVPMGVNGTLEDVFINFFGGGTSSGSANWIIQDGTGKTLATGQNGTNATSSGVGTPAGTNVQAVALQLSGVNLRFQNGLVFNIQNTNSSNTSSFNVNCYYRTP